MAKTTKTTKKPPVLEKFLQKVSAKLEGKKFVINPKGEISMSDAISKIIAPYKQDASEYKAFKSLVTLACTAWNLSIQPINEREDLLEKILESLRPDKESISVTRGLIKELIVRKQRLFPNVNRRIIDFKVTDLGNDFHIAVASTLKKK